MFQQLLVSEFATALGQDFLGSHESGHRHHSAKSTFFADPHVGRIVDMLFLELEGVAVVDVVADVLLIGQHLALGAVIPWAIQIGADGNSVEAVGDGRDGQVILNQPLKHLIDRGHFRIGARHQNDPVGLQALVFTALQDSFEIAALVEKHPAQTKPCRAALPKTQLNQAATVADQARVFRYLWHLHARKPVRTPPQIQDRGAAGLLDVCGSVWRLALG